MTTAIATALNDIIDVSIILPIYNGERWVNQCFESIMCQSAVADGNLKLEVVAYNDSSTDRTADILKCWRDIFATHRIKYFIVHSEASSPRGGTHVKGWLVPGYLVTQACHASQLTKLLLLVHIVGAAKNIAVKKSSGKFLCFQDVDDIMLPRRIEMQLEAAQQRHEYLIGSKFRRVPEGSTARFTRWANSLQAAQLTLQRYTSHGPTLIMPTWFCHRSVYNRVGGFTEGKKGTPEDLIFFLKHLQLGGKLFRVDEELLIYTYHTDATTFSVLSNTIWNIRIKHLQEEVLCNWRTFSVWNAGKQGRKFVRSLLPANQDKIVALCDVDANKIGNSYQLYCTQRKMFMKTFPIKHFKEIVPPIVICVKMGMSNGEFEANLKSLNLTEGSDYVVFS